MSHLTDILKNHGGYSNEAIRRIEQAAELERVSARDHSGMTQLPTPMAAAAGNPRKASIIRQTAGMIRSATIARPLGAYHLPLDRSVDVLELRAALREAKVDASTSGAIVENLYACGLVPA